MIRCRIKGEKKPKLPKTYPRLMSYGEIIVYAFDRLENGLVSFVPLIADTQNTSLRGEKLATVHEEELKDFRGVVTLKNKD